MQEDLLETIRELEQKAENIIKMEREWTEVNKEIAEKKKIEDVSKALDVVAKEFHVEIRVQHEDIFNSMHRI